MKKVVRIFTMLSVLAIGGLLICCSGGGSSSDDDDAPAVSTTSTPTTTTPTSYLARVLYTTWEGNHMVNPSMCESGYYIYEGIAIPAYEPQSLISVAHISSDTSVTPPTVTYSLTAAQGYYLVRQNNRYEACPLPAGIIGNEIDPVTNYWVR